MKRLICSVIWLAVLSAQEKEPAKTAKQEEAKKEEPAKQEEAKKEEAKKEEKAPAVEQPFHAEFEVGARWNQGIKGNLDSYRSIVNLGEGPRLMNWEMRFEPPSLKYLKKMEFRGAGWGGEPAAWMQFRAEEQRYYRFQADYRRTAYFNALPSFANPLLDRGILASQRSFDTNRNFTELSLDLFPTSLIIPYVSYTRDRGYGRGVTSFVSDGNEYPVLNELSDLTNMV